MQSDCFKESSKACFITCLNPLLGLPEQSNPPPAASASTTASPRRAFISSILSSIQPDTIFTNHESLPSFAESISCLQNELPQYLKTVLADQIRAQEYYHLSISNHVCLDYIGQGLFSYSQQKGCDPIADIASTSTSQDGGKMGVPFFDISHKSVSLNSCLLDGKQESQFEATMRKRILTYMNLFEEDYSLAFTANQSSAFKLLADSYSFQSNPSLLTVYDHENEAVQTLVNGAKRKGARTMSAVFSCPKLRVNSKKLRKIIVNKSKTRNRGLFVFPLQSRMTGSRYSYQWMNLARENGWHILLDACALGAKEMETLGLSLFQPDFLIASFFKIFGGNPSGFCCLIVKKSSASQLSQSSSTMGIINLIPAKGQTETLALNQANHQTYCSSYQESQGKAKQKLPTLPEIVELDHEYPDNLSDPKMNSSTQFHGLDHADTLGLILISSRNRCITNWLVNAFLRLRHPNSEKGLPLVRIFGPKIKLERGPAVAFNVYDWKGERVDPILVQKLADRNKISLYCGFLKNIQFSENLQAEKETVMGNRFTKPEEKSNNENRVGVVSVWISMLTNFEDVYRLWAFVSRFLDADFVEKERWRYTALNQTTVEV